MTRATLTHLLTLLALAALLGACADANDKPQAPTDNGAEDTGVPDADEPDGEDTPDSEAPDADLPDEDVPVEDAPDVPLEVVETAPADGATQLPVNSAVSVTFSEPIDPQTLTRDHFRLSPSISGDLLWDDVTRRATFRPNVYMQANTAYTVSLTAGITDRGGEPLPEFSFGFTTGEGTRPAGDTSVFEAGGLRAQVTIDDPEAALRRYTMTSNAPLRDGLPEGGRASFSEQDGQMTLRSGNDVFDALFAMAIEETRLCSVSSISDYAFNQGNGVPCECFETGERWKYVWTRDTAYAVDLGLALVDPARARNSLDFKLSEKKSGGGLQVVQDTGTGGSWPVSSDRVIWALGAWEVLKFLDGPQREAFRDRTLEALTNTIAQDREVVFDPSDGLYRGEQSFLDWREQSYASWTAQDTVHIAMGKSLSTNLGHLIILRVAAALGREAGQGADAQRHEDMARALEESIVEVFWQDEADMLAALKGGELDPSVLHKYELLGQSLAVLQDVLPPAQAAAMVAAYPHAPLGPPVLWPQQPRIPIYHNRGMWPFVTAYGLLAARHVENAAVFDHDLESLARGAALNLSNMENFEFLTQRAHLDDGIYSGPVVNSRRQLWSVAGYIGAVVKGVFGLEATQEGMRLRPFVTPRLRNTWLRFADEVTLRALPYRGRRLTVRLVLPPARPEATEGPAYRVAAVYLNGQGVGDAFLGTDELADGDELLVELVEGQGDGGAVTVVTDDGDFRRIFAPIEPNLNTLERQGDRLRLGFDANGEQGVVFNIYRDGQPIALGVEGGAFTDPDSGDLDRRSYCYAVESVFPSSGHRSHHSRPLCHWGPDSQRIIEISAFGFRQLSGGTWGRTAGLGHYMDWGDPGHSLEVPVLTPTWSGQHLIELVYGNGAGGFDTGITASVKRLRVEDVESREVVAEGVVTMPQLRTWERWGTSTLLPVTLEAGRTYRVSISDGINMSYFAHFRPYTAGTGGGDGVFNRVNIAALRLLAIAGQDQSRDTGDAVALDGDGDFDDFPQAQRVEPGARLQPWEAFALTWDADYLYLAVVSEGFEAPYKPFNLYVEAANGPLPAAQGGQGLEYSDLRPALPFRPTHLVSLRRLSEDGAPDGPWNGIWVDNGEGLRRLIRLDPADQWWLSEDAHVISARIPRAALGHPTRLRLAGHLVNAAPANEWKLTVPAGHTPWAASDSGYYEIDLSQPTAATGWQLR